jgi:fibronectin type 3 domain-containing protein
VTFPDTVPPSAPGKPAVAISGHQVTLNWAPATDDVAVTGYIVYRDGVQLTAGVIGTSYTDSTVAELKRYSYTVRAVDFGSNVGPPSPAALVSTPDWTAPTAPTVAANGAGAGKIAVHWSGARDNVKVSGYDVYRDGKVVAGAVHGTRWTDANLRPGSRHRYRVVATDAAGNRSLSSNVVTATAPLIAPFVHINLTPGSVKPKARFTVYGSVRPAVAHGVLLQVYRSATHRWVGVQRMTTGMRSLPNGNRAVGYAFTLSQSAKGTYAYRVVWQAGGGYAGVITRSVRVTVH